MALYLVYLRYCSIFFGAIAVLNIFFVILFITGTPLDIDNFRINTGTQYPMQALTILNVSGTEWKIVVSFVNAMVVITAGCFHLILSYNNKFKYDDQYINSRLNQIELQKKQNEKEQAG